jgi:signal transduction histidine kinase
LNKVKTILFTTCILLQLFDAQSQNIERFNVFSYNVNEGLLQSTISDLAFDKNNFCWLSFPNGIQKFDGKNFTVVPVQPGLPDDKMCFLYRCSNGDLLVSHSEGISKYDINSNKFVQVYKSQSLKKLPVQFIGEDENIVYFYTSKRTIAGLDYTRMKKVSEVETHFPENILYTDYKPRFSSNIINHRVAINVNSVLYLWDLQQGKVLQQPEPVPGMLYYFLVLKNANEVIYCSTDINNAVQQYNFETKKYTQCIIKGKDDKQIGRFVIYNWKNKNLVSFNNRLYQTDSTLQHLTAEMVNFQNQPVASQSSIWDIKEDNFGNLYLITVTGGIRKIIRNNYPVKYYGTQKQEDNFILSLMPDKKNNCILAGTAGNGVLIFDTLQKLVKHIKTLPGQTLPFSASSIIKTPQGNYLLFLPGEKYIWTISNDLHTMDRISINTQQNAVNTGIGHFANFLFQNNDVAVIQSQSNIYKTAFKNKSVKEYTVTKSYTMSSLLFNGDVVTHANDELIFLDTVTFKEVKKIPFKNTSNVRCFAKDAANNLYLGSNKGIFKIDAAGKILLHLTKQNGLPDECIYAMAFDDEGFLWCSTNKGILKINKYNSIVQLKKEDGLQENEFNTNVVATAGDGEIFFGGVNGVSSFYPAAINSFEEKINLIFTKIKINNEESFTDTAVWNIDRITLPYNKNSLSFDFIAMANNNPGQYIYQYKMDGLDNTWIQNTDLQTVRYFLPPGKYTFKIYASRFFDKNAVAMKTIHIIITPPFWKTWWFLTALLLLFISATVFSINLYNKRKYRNRLAALESERKIQLERERISRDLHDSIGAYANAVLYNTELLQKDHTVAGKNDLMNELKFASKDIITSLRETVWALKKDHYTAEDCWMRIMNFVQALSRYYPALQFKISGDAPEKRALHHTTALNAVRIIQESVTNAIKHARATTIHISSTITAGKWMLTVKDDGKGFDHDVVNETGNGMNNMKQRAAESGFGITVSSGNTGTSISIII